VPFGSVLFPPQGKGDPGEAFEFYINAQDIQ